MPEAESLLDDEELYQADNTWRLTKIERLKCKTDKLVRLGFGMTTYRDTIIELIGIFLFISVLCVPQIFGYYNCDGYRNSIHTPVYLEKFTLGNLGYSQMQCKYMPVELNKLFASCAYGYIGEIVDFGISRPFDGNPSDQCATNDNNKACVPDNPAFIDIINGFVGQSGIVEAQF